MITPRIESSIWFLNDGGLCATIQHWTPDAPPASQADLQATCEAFGTFVSPYVLPLIPATCSLEFVQMRYYAATIGYSAEDASIAAIGTHTTTGSCPAETAVVVRKYGNGPPKRAQGTMFFPCVPEGFTTASRLTQTALALYQTFATDLFATQAFGNLALTPVVMSRTANALYNITNATVQSILGHQRRRRPHR